MMIGELQIREAVRLHNQEAEARHLHRESCAAVVLRSLDWSDQELRSYQDRVAGIGDRLAAVLSRNPKVMRHRRLVR